MSFEDIKRKVAKNIDDNTLELMSNSEIKEYYYNNRANMQLSEVKNGF